MRTLPKSLQSARCPTGTRPSEMVSLLDGAERTDGWLPVKAITPVLGGGVESFEPDNVDVVRVPSIRGAVRWWWRALQPGLSVSELLARERRIWGGVGDGPDDCFASAVRVEVRVTKPGRVFAAGKHERRDDGVLRALPKWTSGAEYGYALFPLQQSNEARSRFGGHGDMPTKPWREDLEFDVRARLDRASDNFRAYDGKGDKNRKRDALSPEEECKLLKDAFRLWLTFGGYGARTRRGFGALSARGYTLEEAERTLKATTSLDEITKGSAAAERPTLRGCRLVPKESRRTYGDPATAHRALLAALREFRQGTTFGRNPGQNKREGRSRWPEADSLRFIVGKDKFRVHPPHKDLTTPTAPRAEFGLPILVQFVTPDDKSADGEIVLQPDNDAKATDAKDKNLSSSRWASPLLLRPVSLQGGGFAPVALVLRDHRPTEVLIRIGKGKNQLERKRVIVRFSPREGGASGPVRDALKNANGSALDAFANWLEGKVR